MYIYVKRWWQAGTDIHFRYNSSVMVSELLLKDDSFIKVIDNHNYIKLWNGTYVLISNSSGIQGISTRPSISEFPVNDSTVLLPANVSKHENKQYWLEISIPSNATKCIYSGTIYVKNETNTLKTIPIYIDVLPFDLPNPLLNYSIYYRSYYDPNASISSEKKNEQQLESRND